MIFVKRVSFIFMKFKAFCVWHAYRKITYGNTPKFIDAQKVIKMKTVKATRNAKNQKGFVLTSELIILSTSMVAALVIGLATLRDSVTAELEDVAEAIGSLDQSYAFDGIVNGEATAEISGSGFVDAVDTNAGDQVAFSFVDSDFSETAASISATASTAADGPAANGSFD